MSTIKRIQVGLGGTEYTTAEIQYAVALAGHHGATLTAIKRDERRVGFAKVEGIPSVRSS
ncbi:MAG: hypothetical protein IPK83_14065 [Planctomycetes bacterium]|nr:hypothetical protein [Planctomycetota bacterium]